MTDRNLTATDAALRERIGELCVHIPCGGLRGTGARQVAVVPRRGFAREVDRL